MVAPYRFKSAAELIGTWPMVPHPVDGYADTHLLTGNLIPQARILGTVRADDGYAVSAANSFVLNVDGTPCTIVLNHAGTTISLQELIDNINIDVNETLEPDGTVAYDDNNFLLLKSPTSGADSYLKVIPVDGDEALMAVLGLTANSESFGGDIASTSHIDPTRQVGTHGQIAPNWGENLTVDNFNRLAMQLAMDSERVYGLVARKRLAVRKEVTIDIDSVTVDEWQLQGDGVGLVYMGPTAAPDADHLEDYITILDLDYNEYTVEKENIAHSYPSSTATCALETDTGNQLVTLNGGTPFDPDDDKNDYYVRLNGMGSLTPDRSAYNGRLWKILEYRSPSQVVVSNKAEDGTVVTMVGTTGTGTQESVQIQTQKVRALGFYSDATCDTRAEQIKDPRGTAKTVTRVERNNRVYCAAGDFLVDGVIAGDLVYWNNSGNSTPFSNFTGGTYPDSGTPYRVLSVLDAKTLELAGNDFGPVMLNAVGTLGEITIKSDGDFLTQPYVKFEDPLAVPTTDFIVVYMGASTLQDTSSDVAAFAGSVRYSAETSSQVQKAILGIVGPSVDNMTDALAWLYQDRRNNLENTINQLGKEHYRDDSTEGGGRHSNIRPDTIDMFPGITGETLILRSAAADTVTTYKAQLKNNTGNRLLYIDALGGIGIGDSANGTASYALNIAKSTGAAKIKLFTSSGAAGIDMLATGTDITNTWTVNSGTVSTKLADNGGDYVEMLLASGATHLSFNGYRSAVSYPNALVVTSGGRVGVGLTSPSSAFHVKNRTSAQEWMALENYGTEVGYLGFHFNGWTTTRDGRIGFLETNTNFYMSAYGDLIIRAGDAAANGNKSIFLEGGTGGHNVMLGMYRAGDSNVWGYFQLNSLDIKDGGGTSRVQFGKYTDGGADDGLITVRSAGANIDLNGEQLERLETWSDITDTVNFVIRELSIAKGHEQADGGTTLYCYPGVWFCNGKVYNRTSSTNIDCSDAVAYLDGEDPTADGWRYAFISTAGVLKLGYCCPEDGMIPNAAEVMTGSGDTNRSHWTYLGSFYYNYDLSTVVDFYRQGDKVYFAGFAAGLPVSQTISRAYFRASGPHRIYVTSSVYPWDDTNSPHSRVSGIIITGSGAFLADSTSSSVDIVIHHVNAQSSAHEWPAYTAASIPVSSTIAIPFQTGQLEINGQWYTTDPGGVHQHGFSVYVATTADLKDTTDNYISLDQIGYIEPLGTASSSKHNLLYSLGW